MATYYPDQTIIMPVCSIRRQRLLPPGVIGEVMVRPGEHVTAFDLVAKGARTGHYVILDMREILGVRSLSRLDELILVGDSQVVREGDLIAGDPDRRRHQFHSPVTGMVSGLLEGRLVIRTGIEEVRVTAGFNGVVSEVVGTQGIVLHTTGALVQGAWGNGQSHFAVLQMEPKDGLSALEVNEFATEWRGAVVLTQQPLTRVTLGKAAAQGLGGVIGPSMHADLRPVAQDLKMPIILTEGFGEDGMNALAYEVLAQYAGRQVAVNAHLPQRWQPERPEVIVPLRNDPRTPPPSSNEALQIGAAVRITRQPYLGMVGQVIDLPKTPQVIDNGLRLLAADVRLPSGNTVTVPLANLELFGRG
ncbi:MAG: hypothetical protein JW910_15845 [Anaerolineae bacterium]|nr:hypothetical protein [Anaerolineae bacterium]